MIKFYSAQLFIFVQSALFGCWTDIYLHFMCVGRWLTLRSLWAPSIKYILLRELGNFLSAIYKADLRVEYRCNSQVF